MEFEQNLKIYAKEHDVPITYDVTLEFLIKIINDNKSMKILEIGTAIGYGSIAMAKNTNCKHIDTIEIDKDSYEKALNNIKICDLDNKISVYNMDAKDYLLQCDNTYDLIYLDGPKGQYANYLPSLIKLLNDDGIIVADNVFFHGMVTGLIPTPISCRAMIKGLHKFINEITTSSIYNSQIFNIGDGVAVIKKHANN